MPRPQLLPVPKLEAGDALTICGARGGKGHMGTKSGTPGPHREKGAGSAEGKEHVTGSQLAFWPQAQGSTGRKGTSSHVQTAPPPPSSKDSQGSKFSFNPKFQGLDSDGKISGPRMARGWSIFHPIREPAKLLSESPFHLVPQKKEPCIYLSLRN